MAKNNYNIEIKEDETILDFFKRCCEENGFNVSKLMKYLEYIDNYIYDNLIPNEEDENEPPIVSALLQEEIVEFCTYFIENYDEDTREKRMQVYGTRDAFCINIFYLIVANENVRISKEQYDSLSNFEQRKFDRVYNQLLNIDGKKTFLILSVDEQTGEDCEPFAILMSKDFTPEENKEASNLLRAQLLDMYVNQGVLIVILENDNPKKKETIKIFGVVLTNNDVKTINARQLLTTFAAVNENMSPSLLEPYAKDDDLEFMDGDFYINPFCQSEREFNQIGKKLPDRKGLRKKENNVIPFSSIIRKDSK